jgi:NDP-sugar pyrophosphorylase family protein
VKDLYIIAAGYGSRMGGSVPKALIEFNGEPNLTRTLRLDGWLFDKVYVVINKKQLDPWFAYFQNLDEELMANVEPIDIESGRGDGHATLNAMLKTPEPESRDETVIIWGDVFLKSHLSMLDLLARPMEKCVGVVPVVYEDNPYVALKLDDAHDIKWAEFAKLEEFNEEGYHDQSMFRFWSRPLRNALRELHASLSRGDRYTTVNHELSLLYVFHYFYNHTVEPMTGDPSGRVKAYVSKFTTLSYNTIEDLSTIQKLMTDDHIPQA